MLGDRKFDDDPSTRLGRFDATRGSVCDGDFGNDRETESCAFERSLSVPTVEATEYGIAKLFRNTRPTVAHREHCLSSIASAERDMDVRSVPVAQSIADQVVDEDPKEIRISSDERSGVDLAVNARRRRNSSGRYGIANDAREVDDLGAFHAGLGIQFRQDDAHAFMQQPLGRASANPLPAARHHGDAVG